MSSFSNKKRKTSPNVPIFSPVAPRQTQPTFDGVFQRPIPRRQRSPTFHENDGTAITAKLNALQIKMNKQKAAINYIKEKGLWEDFEIWYKNNN